MLGLLGKKLGMTQVYDENGNAEPVTVIEVGPCTVVSVKTKESDGYDSLQLGFGTAKACNMTKPLRGHFEKKGVGLSKHVREFRTEKVSEFKVGDRLCVAAFNVGDFVDVQGTTKGRGTQGVIKRHGKHGGPASHGSDFHRRPGSIGMRTWPGHVFKNMKMPGHYGDETVTIRNLRVIAVRPDDNVLMLRGAIPGAREGVVAIINRSSDFASRPALKIQDATATA